MIEALRRRSNSREISASQVGASHSRVCQGSAAFTKRMITLPASCRFNNSLGDDVEYDFWLAQGYPPRRV